MPMPGSDAFPVNSLSRRTSAGGCLDDLRGFDLFGYWLRGSRLRFHLTIGQFPYVLEQMSYGCRQLMEIVGVQALIGSVSIGLRVLNTEQQCRRAAEQVRQRTNEADGAATADAGGFAAET